MWFIFPLIPAVISSVAALYTVTQTGHFAVFAIAMGAWERNYGYRKGEGRLTERENGYYGVSIDASSDHDITSDLGRLAKTMPTAFFAALTGRKYDFTVSEGAMFRTILLPAIKMLEEFEEIKAIYIEDPANEDLLQVFERAMELLTITVMPVVLLLQQFPKKRIKVIKF